jgi:hypothetical protein
MPTREGFVSYLRKIRLIKTIDNSLIERLDFITTDIIPDDSELIDNSFAWALSTALSLIKKINSIDYDRAVYSLTLHDIILNSGLVFFDPILFDSGLHLQYNSFLMSTTNNSTSVNFSTPTWLASLSPFEQKLLKTQPGRNYFEILSLYKEIIPYSE